MVERDEREAAGLIDLYARVTDHPELCLLQLGMDVESVSGIVKERIELRKVRELLVPASNQ